MLESNKKLLEKEWNNIVRKVILPLWRKKFCIKYMCVKMDENDFISMAGEELAKAMHIYNPSKGDLFGYAYNVITKKANTEIRNMNRDIRKSNVVAVSLNRALGDKSDDEVGDSIVGDENCECKSTAVCDIHNIRDYYHRLSEKQQMYLLLKEMGVSDYDIADGLELNKKELNDLLKSMQQPEKVSILTRRRNSNENSANYNR